MSDRFEEAVRDAALGLGAEAGQAPTYHDAWQRGRRRRKFKQSALAIAGACVLFAVANFGLARIPETPSTDVDDIALETDVIPAEPTQVPPPPATPTVVPSPPADPTAVPADASAVGPDAAIEASTPEPTASAVPATAVPVPPATAVPQPTAAPTSTPVPTTTAVPTATPSPTATPIPPPTPAAQRPQRVATPDPDPNPSDPAAGPDVAASPAVTATAATDADADADADADTDCDLARAPTTSSCSRVLARCHDHRTDC